MAVKTQGTQLYLIDPADDSVITVGCITSISGINAARDQIETTCLDSAARTYVAGLASPGAAQFSINFDPDDQTHIRLHELYVAGEDLQWTLGWSDGVAPPTVLTEEFVLPSTRTWISFDGFLSDVTFDFSLNSVVASQVSVQVSGFPVVTPKA